MKLMKLYGSAVHFLLAFSLVYSGSELTELLKTHVFGSKWESVIPFQQLYLGAVGLYVIYSGTDLFLTIIFGLASLVVKDADIHLKRWLGKLATMVFLIIYLPVTLYSLHHQYRTFKHISCTDKGLPQDCVNDDDVFWIILWAFATFVDIVFFFVFAREELKNMFKAVQKEKKLE